MGRISKRVFQENKARQIFRETNISYPLIRTRTGGKKCLFFGKFDVFYLLETPVLRFTLLPIITDEMIYKIIGSINILPLGKHFI